jgi:hypothetical protein
MPATEFGGNPNPKTGVQPPPHVPTPSERLSLLYRTGDESGNTDPSEDVFMGLRSEETQRALREAEGVMAKGQEWDRLQQEGQAALGELPKLEGQ